MPWKSTVAKPPPPILSMYPFINFASGLSNPLFVFQVPFDVQSTVTPESPPVSSTMTPETGLMISPWEPFAPACALPPPALLFQFNWATSGKPAISSGVNSVNSTTYETTIGGNVDPQAARTPYIQSQAPVTNLFRVYMRQDGKQSNYHYLYRVVLVIF